MTGPATFPDQLHAALATAERPVAFCAAGTSDLPVVQLRVDGVGCIGLPVSERMAAELVAVAKPAPYGRGEQTLYDETVRSCLQIAAHQVDDSDRRWQRTVATIVARVRETLGVQAKVESYLYKLLVYRPNDFFAVHRDTEKQSRMFATLVIVLPGSHAGGELVIHHGGQTERHALGGDDLGVAHWAAFYADCRHELLPVEAGYRVALVYNLVTGSGPRPVAANFDREIAATAGLLKAWFARAPDLAKVVLPLSHAYSIAELEFDRLKGSDAGMASVLVAAARQSDCEACLAIVAVQESGSAESDWYGSRHRPSQEQFTIQEVFERSVTLGHWRAPDGVPCDFGAADVEDQEVGPAGALDDDDDEHVEFREATGNEGASFERQYQIAALVVFPRANTMAVVAQGGRAAGVAALTAWCGDPARCDDAAKLAQVLVDGWPAPPDSSVWHRANDSSRGPFLEALARLPDVTPLRQFARRHVTAGGFGTGDTAGLLLALRRLDPAEAAATLCGLVPVCLDDAPADTCAVVAEAVAVLPDDDMLDVTENLLEQLGTPPASGRYGGWHDEQAAQQALTALLRLADTLTHSRSGSARAARLAAQVATTVTAAPHRFDPDSVVTPALLAMGRQRHAAFEALVATALGHLRARIGIAQSAPVDAVRDASALKCTCVDCASVRRFMANPAQPSMVVRAVQHQRSHVESHCKSAELDLDYATLRSGSPHGLQLTKNRASYDRFVEQRQQDLANVRRLTGLLGRGHDV